VRGLRAKGGVHALQSVGAVRDALAHLGLQRLVFGLLSSDLVQELLEDRNDVPHSGPDARKLFDRRFAAADLFQERQ